MGPGLHISRAQQRAFEQRRAEQRAAWTAARTGSAGPAGPCRRRTVGGEITGTVERHTIEVPAGRLRLRPRWPWIRVMPPPPLSAVVLSIEALEALDGRALIPLVAATVGQKLFTSRELCGHAKVEGGLLAAMLAGRTTLAVGRALSEACGLSPVDGFSLIHVGQERGRVALWQIVLPGEGPPGRPPFKNPK